MIWTTIIMTTKRAAAPSSPSYTGRLTIDLTSLKENYKTICAYAGSEKTVMASVKADGYGLGATEVVSALMEAGCLDFLVAMPEEGIKLRCLSDTIRIFTLNGFFSQERQIFREYALIPCLGSLPELNAYGTWAWQRGERLPAVLHFDTGMTRQGFDRMETEGLMQDSTLYEGLDICFIMSHFASADEPGSSQNEEQYERFSRIAQAFPFVPKSLCNSFGLFRNRRYHFDILRPGMALYGLNPKSGEHSPVKPVVSLELPVIRLRAAGKGDTIGYNATYRFDRETPLAVLSCGYGDGIFRALSNSGQLYWKGVACPIRGRVSMDMLAVDLSAVPADRRPKPGDFLELIGPHQSADALAAAAGTIGYEVLTALGPRYARHYME